MFDYFRYDVTRQSAALRALIAVLALSLGVQICAPASTSASDSSVAGDSIHSSVIELSNSNPLDSNHEHLECCVFSALHDDRGQVSSQAVTVDASYPPPVSPPTVMLAETTPAGKARCEFEPVSVVEIAFGPVYLATRRLRI